MWLKLSLRPLAWRSILCLYVYMWEFYTKQITWNHTYICLPLSLSLSPYLLILPIYGHYRLVTILYPKLISFVLNFSMFICKLCTIDTYLYVQNDMLVKRFNKLLVHVLSSKTHYKICLDIKSFIMFINEIKFSVKITIQNINNKKI